VHLTDATEEERRKMDLEIKNELLTEEKETGHA
jgi:hypothetical protein